jgi:hypothetical protein
LNVSTLTRVVAAALALSTLSFAAGVAGDLSMATPPNYGERVVLRIPPAIPADAQRAAPLPPMLSTASAEAAPSTRRRFAPIDVNFAYFAPIEAQTGDIPLLDAPKASMVFALEPDERRKNA